jgi:hypothetical protein
LTEKRDDIFNLIDKISEQEETITKRVIVSPVFYNKRIIVRVHGIIHYLKIPKTEPGWYTFKALNNKQAEVTAPAEIDQIQSYLKYLPKIRFILVQKKKNSYLGVPIKGNQFGFKISDLFQVLLCDDTVTSFSKCLCRFDGANIWFESIDISTNLSIGDYLNESLDAFKDPLKIKIPGLTLEEKIAYNIRFKIEQKIKEQREELLEEKKKSKIQRDVEFAGGKFIQSSEKSDHFYVTYEIDGDIFHSIVSKDQRHHVITAGICLTDHETGRAGDTDFDLKALVSVIKEGQHIGEISKTLW